MVSSKLLSKNEWMVLHDCLIVRVDCKLLCMARCVQLQNSTACCNLVMGLICNSYTIV